ncbi:MAG: EAL domain-containing protein [Clostridia bacterium]|nr:EAL domain-containing protein [Clostridia bacterium]
MKTPRISKSTILVVDDVPVNRLLLKEIFSNDADVIEASNGQEALDILSQHHQSIGAVILDIQMPVLDGWQTLEHMRTNPMYTDIPVIIITGENDVASEIRAFVYGAVDYITKPFNSLLVQQRVSNSLLKRELETLRAQKMYQTQLQEIVNKVAGGALILNISNNLIKVEYCNETCTQILGYNVQELNRLFARKTKLIIHPADAPMLINATLSTMADENKTLDLELRLRVKSGEYKWFYCRGNRLKEEDEGSKQLFMLIMDINESKKEKEHIEYITMFDELTKIFNRSTFYRTCNEYLKANPNTEYVMAYLSIEGFKLINSTYGNEVRDKVLQHVGGLFMRVYGTNAIYGRLGTGRFGIMSPKALFSPQRLLKLLHSTTDYLLADLPVVFNIGLCDITDHTLSIERYSDMAEMAEHSIQGNTEQRIALFNEQMQHALIEERTMLNDMHKALQDGQFVPYYQPIYSFTTNKISGAELLVRWLHPKKGLIAPNTFIPLFENNGFITKLDIYMWRQACQKIRTWLDNGVVPIPLSVNLSRIDLIQENIVSKLTSIVREYKVPSSLLKIEITESAYTDSQEQIITVVNQMRKKGFSVQIDDFGSGYSSFNTLKDINADTIKLDIRFLMNNYNSPKAISILSSIIRMARWLDMTIIAEGVEDIDKANYLSSIGCHLMQGYYFARPMREEDFDIMLSRALTDKTLLRGKENAHNMQLWSLDDTNEAVFSRYIGGAIVLEYDSNQVEIHRVNQEFRNITGLTNKQIDDVALNAQELWRDKDRKNFATAVSRARKSGDETDVICCLNPRLSKREMWFRLHMYLIAENAPRSLLLTRVENITHIIKSQNKQIEFNNDLASMLKFSRKGIMLLEQVGDDFRFIYDNMGVRTMTGYTQSQFKKAFPNYPYPLYAVADSINNVLDHVRQSVTSNCSVEFLHKLHMRNGHLKPVKVYIDVIHNSSGSNPRVLILVIDEEQEIEREIKLKLSQEKYRMLAGVDNDYIFEYNIKDDVLIYSKALPNSSERITKTISNYTQWAPQKNFLGAEELLKLRREYDTVNGTTQGSLEFQSHDEKGEHWYHMHYAFINDQEGNAYRLVGRIEDIQQKKDEEYRLIFRATYDSITNLYNRATIEDKIDKLLTSNNVKGAFFLLDLDNFKDVNDTYGHLMGDELLKRTGESLLKMCHKDDLVGRAGGDEFVGLILDVDEKRMIGYIEQFLGDIARLQKDMNLKFRISASIGITMLDSNTTFKDLFRAADTAMFTAKRGGKGKALIFDPTRIKG